MTAKSLALFGVVLLLSSPTNAQVFRNLDFEEAVVPPPNDIHFEDLFPGWQAVIPTNAWAAIYYDIVMDSPLGYTLSDSAENTMYGWAESVVLSGRHSAILVVSEFNGTNALGLRQTGLIPSGTRTIRFKATPRSLMSNAPGRWGVALLVNGQVLPTALMQASETQAVWNCDATDVSGKVAELQLEVWLDCTQKPLPTVGTYVAVALDDITFSPEPLATLPTATESNIVAWGKQVNTVPLPTEATNLLRISPGVSHTAAIGAGGQVFTWGEPISAAPPPPGLSNVVATSASDGLTYAVTSEGRVFIWPATNNIVPGISDAVAISANATFALVLRADGTVIPLGTMDRFWWGFGPEWTFPAYVPSGLSNVAAVAAGGLHGLALRTNGKVEPWVHYISPPPWPGSFRGNAVQTNVPPGATNIVAIAAGAFHSLALRQDGLVFAWGENDYGQTNVPPNLSNVVAIAAGNYHSVALRNDGTLLAWGDNVYGQTNIPAGLTNVISVSAGGNQSIAIVGKSVPPTNVPIARWDLGPNGFEVSVPTQAGRVYRLEYSDRLNTGTWCALPLVSGNGSARILLDPTPGPTARFYRVARW